MTFKQLTSPEVREWCHQKSVQIEEGAEFSREDIMNEFKEWFKTNENNINESNANKSILKELKNVDIEDFDDEDEVEVETPKKKISTRKTEVVDIEDEDDSWKDNDEDEIENDEGESEEDEVPTSDIKDVEDEEDSENSENIDDEEEEQTSSIKDVEDDEEDEDEKTEVTVEPTVDVEDEVEVDDDAEDEEEDKFEDIDDKPIEIEDIDAPMEEKTVLSDAEIDKMGEEIGDTVESEGEYVVYNDPKNPLHHIFNVVNIWYDLACQDGTNKDDITFLYFLDTSNVTNMTALFAFANVPNINLEKWDTSNVKYMEGMFYKSTFNNPSIEKWDVSSCINFRNMFYASNFRYDISGWTPGTTMEPVYDKDGKIEKEEVRAISGEIVLRDKYEPKPVELPFVGARLSHAQLEKNKKMKDQMKRFDELIDKKKKEKETEEMEEMEEMKHIYDFDSFVNEGIGDLVNKGVYKAKSFFKTVAMNFKGVFAFLKKDGSVLDVTSPYSSMNYIASGKVPGVKAYFKGESDLLSNVPSVAEEVKKEGYYDFMKPGTQEYDNYKEFVTELSENVEFTGEPLNEDLMPLTAAGSGVGVPDITTTDFRELLRKLIHNNRHETGHASRTLIVFGAPGIGKSTIPNAIIKEFNDSTDSGNPQKSLLAVDCGELTLDGFYLPIPKMRTIDDIAQSHPNLYKLFSSDKEAFDRLKAKRIFQTLEAPKTWLPCYVPSADKAENKLLNDIANGYFDVKEVYNPDTDSYDQVVRETTEGGILLFDEFFRANSEVFKNIKEIINTGKTLGGQVLGSKWSILACSNRPNDDDEVKDSRNDSSPVLGNRFLRGACNLIPEFEEWKAWAQDEDLLDDFTLAFITGGSSSDGSSVENRYDIEVPDFSKEEKATKKIKAYHRWHAVDPKRWKSSSDETTFMFPTPRTWAALLEQIKEYIAETEDCESVLDIHGGELRRMATMLIGEETGNDYADYIVSCKKLPFRPFTREIRNSKGEYVGKREFFTFPEKIDKKECDAIQTCEYITSFFVGHYTNKRKGYLNPSDAQMYDLAQMLYKSYTLTGGSSQVTNLHNDIIRKVFNIKSTDEKKIKKYSKYLEFVKKEYGIVYADEAY